MKYNKNGLELLLNDTPLNKLPDKIRKIVIDNHFYGTKYGQWLRNNHRQDFDEYFKVWAVQEDAGPKAIQSETTVGNPNVQAVPEGSTNAIVITRDAAVLFVD